MRPWVVLRCLITIFVGSLGIGSNAVAYHRHGQIFALVGLIAGIVAVVCGFVSARLERRRAVLLLYRDDRREQ